MLWNQKAAASTVATAVKFTAAMIRSGAVSRPTASRILWQQVSRGRVKQDAQKICRKGTQGSHLSVRTTRTKFSATAANPTSIGPSRNIPIRMDRRSIPSKASGSSCTRA